MKLNEVMVATNPQLSDNQAKVLLQVYLTNRQPVSGMAALQGSEYSMTAGEQLLQQQLIQMVNGGVMITSAGVNALKNQGLLDEFGQATDLAQKLNTAQQDD